MKKLEKGLLKRLKENNGKFSVGHITFSENGECCIGGKLFPQITIIDNSKEKFTEKYSQGYIPVEIEKDVIDEKELKKELKSLTNFPKEAVIEAKLEQIISLERIKRDIEKKLRNIKEYTEEWFENVPGRGLQRRTILHFDRDKKWNEVNKEIINKEKQLINLKKEKNSFSEKNRERVNEIYDILGRN